MATTSDRFSLTSRDFVKGLIVAVILPVLTIIQQSISHGELTFDWKLIGLTAAGGLVAYLIKNFFTDSVAEARATLNEASKP